MTDDPTIFARFGEYLIGAALAFIAWVMKTFTSEHLSTMKSIEAKLGEMQADIRVLKEHAVNTDRRLEKIEDGR